MSTSTELAKAGPGELVAQYRDDYAMVLPSHIDADHWVRMVQTLMRRNPTLANVARKNPGSFCGALLDCAHKGLEPGTTYHLVPFGNEIVGITDWKGELDLVLRSGTVSSVKCEVVYENDRFEFNTSMDRPIHEADWFGERGDMVGGYAYAVMKDGTVSRVVIMSREQIEDVKKVSKTANKSDSIWNRWPDRAWRKTLMHALVKWLPQSAEFRDQMMASTAALGRVSEPLRDMSVVQDYPDGDGDDDLDPDSEIVEAEIVDDDEPTYTDDDPGRPFDDGPEMANDGQQKALRSLMRKAGVMPPNQAKYLSDHLGRDVTGVEALTGDEAGTLIEALQVEPSAEGAA